MKFKPECSICNQETVKAGQAQETRRGQSSSKHVSAMSTHSPSIFCEEELPSWEKSARLPMCQTAAGNGQEGKKLLGEHVIAKAAVP